MTHFPYEWQTRPLDPEDFEHFIRQFTRAALHFLPFAEGPISFFDPETESEENLHSRNKPKYWYKYIKRVTRQRCSALAVERPVLFMPVWGSSDLIGIMSVEGIDPQFANVLSDEWLSDRSRIISREFFSHKQLCYDPVTSMFNGYYLMNVLDVLVLKDSTRHVSVHGSLFLIETYPQARNAEKALHEIARAGYHLESFLGQNMVCHLGNGIFGLVRPDLGEEQAQKLGKNILGWFRREGFSRIHIGINTMEPEGRMTAGVRHPDPPSSRLLEQTWQALRQAGRRGPYSLCTYKSISNHQIHPLKRSRPGILAKLRRFWDGVDVFSLLLLSRDQGQHGEGIPKRLLALIEPEVSIVPIDEGEFFVFLKDAKHHEAEAWIRDFKKRIPADVDTTFSAGIAYYPCIDFNKSDIPRNSRKALLHASFYGPDSIALFDGVSQNVSGDIYYGEGDLIRAVKEYSKGLQLDDTNINLLNSLGETYARLDKPKKARSCFEKILAMEPKNFMALFNLGVACLATGDDEEAIKYFERTLTGSRRRLEKNQLNDLLLQLSKLYCRTGSYKKAAALLEKEKIFGDKDNRAPGRGIILRYLGEAYQETGKNREAISVLQRAVRLNPHDASSLSMLGELYSHEGEGDDIALSLCLQAVEIDDRCWRHWYRLAAIQFKLGQFESALETIKQCLQLNRKGVTVMQLAGKIYEKLGMETKSIGLYKKIGMIGPGRRETEVDSKEKRFC